MSAARSSGTLSSSTSRATGASLPASAGRTARRPRGKSRQASSTCAATRTGEAGSLEDLSGQLRVWLAQVANARTHGTTHRIVSEAWQEEKAHLQQIGARPPYPFVQEQTRRISEDAYVAFRTNRYAAPWEAAGKEVCVRLVCEQVQILHAQQVLAVHPLCTGRHQRIEDKALHAGMPFGGARSHRKTRITIAPAGPTVEQRSLEVYAEAAGCGSTERAA